MYEANIIPPLNNWLKSMIVKRVMILSIDKFQIINSDSKGYLSHISLFERLDIPYVDIWNLLAFALKKLTNVRFCPN